MSTAQEQQTITPTAEEMAAADAAAAAAAAAAVTTTTTAAPEGKSNSRSYTLFEEARQDTWTKIMEIEADSEPEALNSLGEKKLSEPGKRFMAIPSRFVRPRKPKVDTVTTISYD